MNLIPHFKSNKFRPQEKRFEQAELPHTIITQHSTLICDTMFVDWI
jgi:hypothetical protein